MRTCTSESNLLSDRSSDSAWSDSEFDEEEEDENPTPDALEVPKSNLQIPVSEEEMSNDTTLTSDETSVVEVFRIESLTKFRNEFLMKFELIICFQLPTCILINI